MQYTIENEFLTVTVDTHGAEVVSAVNKASGAEMIWCGDPAIWGRHAPILFPFVGKLRNGQYRLDGETFSGSGHGFARDCEFEAAEVSGTCLVFRLTWNSETLKKFPRKFGLTVTYTLDGKTLRQETEAANLDSREMRFGLGYHPAFTLPFDDRHTTTDYELRFDTPQQPQEVLFEQALMSHSSRPFMEKGNVIALNDRMFDIDSIFMKNLDAKTVSLTEKDSGRCITMELTGFPYFLIWSALNQEKLHFLCLEPWHAHPDMTDSDGDWNHKPCTAELKPGETWVSHLNVTFNR